MKPVFKYHCCFSILWLILVFGSPAFLYSQNQVLTPGNGEGAAQLSEAIERAEPGSEILMKAGIYNVNDLKITKSITLKGEEGTVLDINGKGFGLIVMGEQIILENFEIRNSASGFMDDYAAILIEDSDDVKVNNLKLRDNFFSVFVAKSQNIVISNNSILSNAERQTKSGNGVHIWYSKDIEVHNNRIEGHRDGIYLEFVESSKMTDNHVDGNIRYGLHFMYSDDCVYTGNLFRDNISGVAVMYSKKVQMLNNQFEDNWGANRYGLLLKEITDSRIEMNRFTQNTVGIYMEASNRIQIESNEFIENGTALRVMANGVDNLVVSNNFIGNVFEVTTNSKQNPNKYEGNYWSRYDGYDLDRDGWGDVPHRPVRLFSVLVERQPAALILMRSVIADLLDQAERLMPALTPEGLVDRQPKMERLQ